MPPKEKLGVFPVLKYGCSSDQWKKRTVVVRYDAAFFLSVEDHIKRHVAIPLIFRLVLCDNRQNLWVQIRDEHDCLLKASEEILVGVCETLQVAASRIGLELVVEESEESLVGIAALKKSPDYTTMSKRVSVRKKGNPKAEMKEWPVGITTWDSLPPAANKLDVAATFPSLAPQFDGAHVVMMGRVLWHQPGGQDVKRVVAFTGARVLICDEERCHIDFQTFLVFVKCIEVASDPSRIQIIVTQCNVPSVVFSMESPGRSSVESDLKISGVIANLVGRHGVEVPVLRKQVLTQFKQISSVPDVRETHTALTRFANPMTLLCRIVERLTSKRAWQQRVFVVAPKSILICDEKAGVRRNIPIASIVSVTRQLVQVKSGLVPQLLFRVAGEHDCLVRHVADPRNTRRNQSRDVTDVVPLLMERNPGLFYRESEDQQDLSLIANVPKGDNFVTPKEEQKLLKKDPATPRKSDIRDAPPASFGSPDTPRSEFNTPRQMDVSEASPPGRDQVLPKRTGDDVLMSPRTPRVESMGATPGITSLSSTAEKVPSTSTSAQNKPLMSEVRQEAAASVSHLKGKAPQVGAPSATKNNPQSSAPEVRIEVAAPPPSVPSLDLSVAKKLQLSGESATKAPHGLPSVNIDPYTSPAVVEDQIYNIRLKLADNVIEMDCKGVFLRELEKVQDPVGLKTPREGRVICISTADPHPVGLSLTAFLDAVETGLGCGWFNGRTASVRAPNFEYISLDRSTVFGRWRSGVPPVSQAKQALATRF